MFSLRSFKESEAFALFSRHPHFRRLFLADAFSQVGQNMLVVAFPTLILEVTHDVTLTGLAFAGEILAYGVLAPWAGLIADRCEQKRLMQIANLGRTAILGLLLWSLPKGFSLAYYLLLSMLLGACGALFTPARAAFLRRLLEGEELVRAAALEGTVMFLLRIIAPAGIGLVMLASNARWGIAFDMLCYLASFVALLPAWVSGPWREQESEQRNIVNELAEGWRAIWQAAELRRLLILDFIISVVGMASWTSAAAFLETVAHVAAANNGWLQAAMGITGALGTRLAVGVRASQRNVAWLLTAVTGTYILLARCHSLQGIVGVWLLRGLVIGVMVVLIAEGLARQVRSEVMGRVQAAWDQAACIACLIGSLITPGLLRYGGATGSFRIYAATMVLVTIAWWGFSGRECSTSRADAN